MIDPLISIRLPGRRSYAPGQEITWHYQIDAVRPGEVAAIEASVLWYTIGKGESDLSVLFFERRVPGQTEVGDLREMRSVRLTLPPTPLSYDGVLLKIRWCARVRLFLRSGREFLEEQVFRLGNVRPARAVVGPGQQLTTVAETP